MFKKKVVVITGATSGIGAATAKLFAMNGASVVMLGRNSEKGMRLQNEICVAGGVAEYIFCDVTDEESIIKMANVIAEKYKVVNVLFNNAGTMLQSCEIERMKYADWKRTFEVNVDGIFLVTRYLKSMIIEGEGTIINNASIAGLQSYVIGRSYAYSASKSAVIQFTRQMAKNYAEDGVRVNCICPGIIETPMLGERDRKVYAERVPLKYIGRAEQVAEVVLFLASENASYITGAIIPVDGGVSLG